MDKISIIGAKEHNLKNVDLEIPKNKLVVITGVSGSLTVAGSPAAGELVYFDIARDHDEGNDDMAEDAKRIGIKLFYTIDDVHEA